MMDLDRIMEFWPVGVLFTACCGLAIVGGGWFMVTVGFVFSIAMTLQMIKRGV
jgi:hypothetical protein